MVRIYGVTSVATSTNSGSSSGINQGIVLTGITQNDGTIYLTTTNTGVENSSNMLIVPANKTVIMEVSIAAKTNTNTVYAAGWMLNGMAKRESSVTSVSLMGISMSSCISDAQLSGLQIFITENISTGGISIQCKGLSQYNQINWISTIVLTEV